MPMSKQKSCSTSGPDCPLWTPSFSPKPVLKRSLFSLAARNWFIAAAAAAAADQQAADRYALQIKHPAPTPDLIGERSNDRW